MVGCWCETKNSDSEIFVSDDDAVSWTPHSRMSHEDSAYTGVGTYSHRI